MVNSCDVAIVGAGPYGLSLAAQLGERGIDYRIFGIPMQTWRSAMPRGMFLKSEAHASSFSCPDPAWTLERYCQDNGIPGIVKSAPVPLAAFVKYGLDFQRCFAPDLETTTVVALTTAPHGYELLLSSGELVRAKRVVLALGTTNFKRVPSYFAALPAELVSHTADHDDLGAMAGRDVVVIGGGQSALETAALASEAGAKVSVLVRAPSVVWNGDPLEDPSAFARLRYPQTGLGRSWRMWFYCNGQELFQYLPEEMRIDRVKRELGPAGAWWLKPRVLGRFPVLAGHAVRGARVEGRRVCLAVSVPDGRVRELRADHVIAATGYQVDVGAIPFLDADLRRRLRCVGTAPHLSRTFESSSPGLYFVGLAAAVRFGPSMRFVVGADYAARRVAGSLCRSIGHRSVPRPEALSESIAS
jgi:FAD-dependent urate hydroxylase